MIKSQSQVGIYGAAYKVIDILTTIPFLFAGVVLPILTADWSAHAEERFKKILQKSFDLMVILAVPLVVGTQLLAGPVMVLVAGSDFAAAGTVLKILIFAAGFVFVSSFLAHVMVALNKQQKIIPAYIFTAITSVIGYLIFNSALVLLFGAAGVTVYSEAAITLFMIFYTWRYAKFFPDAEHFFPLGHCRLGHGAGIGHSVAGFLSARLVFALGNRRGLDPLFRGFISGTRHQPERPMALLLNQEPQESEFL